MLVFLRVCVCVNINKVRLIVLGNYKDSRTDERKLVHSVMVVGK